MFVFHLLILLTSVYLILVLCWFANGFFLHACKCIALFSVAKRSESAARAFSETVDALRACSDLSNADDLIRFIITCSSGHKVCKDFMR